MDQPDHPYILHDEKDPTSSLQEQMGPATVPQDETEPSSAMSRVLPPSFSSGAVSPPSPLKEDDVSHDNSEKKLSESHEEQLSVRPKKERKMRSIKRFHLAASFSGRQLSGGETQCKDGHGCNDVGESESALQARACHQGNKGIQNKEMLDRKLEVKDNPMEAEQTGDVEDRIVETYQMEMQGAVGGMSDETSHVYYNNSSIVMRIKGSMEMGVFHELSGIEQEDVVHVGNEPVENGAVPPPSDCLESIATSLNAREKMCVGYGYPEDWLYTQGQNQQRLEEECRNQSDPVEAAVSSHESSFRGTSREESSLEHGKISLYSSQFTTETTGNFLHNV